MEATWPQQLAWRSRRVSNRTCHFVLGRLYWRCSAPWRLRLYCQHSHWQYGPTWQSKGTLRGMAARASHFMFSRNSKRMDEIANIAGEFIAMSRSIAGDLVDQGDNATGFLGFSCGVIDAMSYQAGLDVSDTQEVLKRYFSRVFNGDVQKVADTLVLVAQIPSSDDWSHSIEAGGRAAIQFLQSKDGYPPYAFTALGKMLSKAKPKT